MNIPNLLTIFRIFLIPLFIIIYFSNIKYNLILSVLIFFLAGFTDFLDGYIARKHNLITKIGIVLDPLADKLMLLTVLVCLYITDYIPSLVLYIILGKELFMILGGIILYKKQIVIPSNKFGKMTTFLFYIAIFTLVINKSLGTILIYLAMVLALIALYSYLYEYYKTKKTP